MTTRAWLGQWTAQPDDVDWPDNFVCIICGYGQGEHIRIQGKYPRSRFEVCKPCARMLGEAAS